MANYPTSDPSFTTKQDGVDYPQASHINDLQAEVTAIGSALRGTLQHAVTVAMGGFTASTGGLRISGPSTLAQLQAGASTVTTLSAGLSTVSDLVVTGTLTVGGAAFNARIPCARVTHGSSQTVASGAWTGLSFNTEDYDSTGIHSTSVNSSRLLLTSSGIWDVRAQASWQAFGSNPSTGHLGIRIVANDNQVIAGGFLPVGVQADQAQFAQQASAAWVATSTTDYLTVQVYQSMATGGAVSGSTGAGLGPTSFWVQRVSP